MRKPDSNRGSLRHKTRAHGMVDRRSFSKQKWMTLHTKQNKNKTNAFTKAKTHTLYQAPPQESFTSSTNHLEIVCSSQALAAYSASPVTSSKLLFISRSPGSPGRGDRAPSWNNGISCEPASSRLLHKHQTLASPTSGEELATTIPPRLQDRPRGQGANPKRGSLRLFLRFSQTGAHLCGMLGRPALHFFHSNPKQKKGVHMGIQTHYLLLFFH